MVLLSKIYNKMGATALTSLLLLVLVVGASCGEVPKKMELRPNLQGISRLIHGGNEFSVNGYVIDESSQRGRTGSDDKCPPCFNCMLPAFECKQFSKCNPFNGRCECIEGFAGDDCSKPLCGSLADDNDHRPFRANGTDSCECDAGWKGINCNICEEDSVCDIFMPDESVKGTCYKEGIIVNKIFQGCDVTNKKILETLKGKIPQVTFSCDKKREDCNFQFWIEQIESFYCGLNNCTFEYDLAKNTSHYKCEDVQCKCVPGELLCGKKGSIDISEFLTETIKGPGDFSCDIKTHDCKFTEPAMNDLISSIFGDPYIMLNCESGECVHHSEIPGVLPPNEDQTMPWQAKLLLAVSSLTVLGLVILVIFYISRSPLFSNNGPIHLPDASDHFHDDDENFLKTDKTVTLTFENISYQVPKSSSTKFGNEQDGKTSNSIKVLNGINGIVQPGQIMAIMGGSGAGKTTLLDILAMKRKSGTVSGTIKLNGTDISRKSFTKLIGFVDQEDYLLPTLTVYETVLNSALLRLPKSMSFEAKQNRVYQVLEELRIFDIKDHIIGNDFERGISGGEKRRVSIACELVTSPLILFLDEPTSGLDANNANNVVECLVRLANTYNRTLVLSIHQPRSNIFHLFHKLVLLGNGEMVYSGDAVTVTEFLRNNGYNCPPDYNIADYLIDITVGSNAKFDKVYNQIHTGNDNEQRVGGLVPEGGSNGNNSAEHSFKRATTQSEWEMYAEHRDELRRVLASSSSDEQGTLHNETVGSMNTKILSQNFKEGQYGIGLTQDVERENRLAQDVASDNFNKNQQCASFGQQLQILCLRTFKNTYRNPKLLLENYILTLLLGVFLGTLYYNLSYDISGFQNRMGLFFFILTYFGFITFTGLSSFALERIIFIKERSNNYYSPLAYYLSKIISDVIPLRVIPPLLLTLIIYPLAGLNAQTGHEILRFSMILILFNVGISLEILAVGIIFKDLNNSIILSVLILLGSILFSGLFINTEDITNVAFKYLKNISMFYYAYEALLINEVKTLMLREKKYGLNIEVPGATILSTFGFQVANFVLDTKILFLANLLFVALGYAALQFFVYEQK